MFLARGRRSRRAIMANFVESAQNEEEEEEEVVSIADLDAPVAKNEVSLWTEDNCFLVNLYNYINMRFITCPGYCLICDRDLDITTYKLPVCGRAECVRYISCLLIIKYLFNSN